ncbi:TonB-dependent receptor [Bradyrhizobium sp. BRP22]|uniref:TonB-dependent receptor domain-containing protein n=1 Tax=Bradyrhizobium sp. BRP22 TaxID=2793821 RepID=UPI001CD28BD8|nr:TonB-dependent receptor [Bradyrhizobium sp. BRP22]MCA1454620.1 TonB-dependent receptor [Bradyrhizobium sp. BRP22]
MSELMSIGGVRTRIGTVAGGRSKRVTIHLLRSAAVCALSAGPVLYAEGAFSQTVQTQDAPAIRQFNIPAQPLTSALNQFGRQSGLQVAFPSEASQGVRSNPVVGSLTPQQALDQLLRGTGISYRITSQGTAVIGGRPSANISDAAAPPPADGSLLLDTINVNARRSTMNGDTPYETPGSVSYISREQLDRLPPTSAGDVFIDTPGVISAGNHVGTSINPNIRGLQGMGRVSTTIDGARQNTSSYRGYIGNRDETYVDPDLIGGVEISKGPSSGVGVGGIGGTVNFRTLEAGDIVKDGKIFGTRVKGSLATNAVAEQAPSFLSNNAVNTAAKGRPSFFNGDTSSGSVAVAAIKENYEFIVAYSKHVQGNYFAGTKVPDGITFRPANALTTTANANSLVKPGQEVFNTSENTDSFLAKGKVKWGDGESLELGYLSYNSNYGELDELSYQAAMVSGILPYGQFPLSETHVDTYTAKYKYEPSDNPYVKMRADLWLTDLTSQRHGLLPGPYADVMVGGDVGNTSVFDTALGQLSWDNGVEFTREHAKAEQFPSSVSGSDGWETYGPSGVRVMTGTFSNASLKPIDWLTLSAGLRYDHYNSNGEGYLTKFPDRSGGRASPNASVVISPIEGIQFYGQYKEGYRPPSLRETHWHYQGLLWNNPDLQPEIAKNYEAGLNILRNNVFQSGDKLRVKLAYFDNHYDDYIVRYQTGSGAPAEHKYVWYNIDSANFRGFEISGNYDAGAFFLEGAFTKYTKIEYCETAGSCAPPTSQFSLASPTGALKNDYAANYVPPDYAGSVTAGVRLFDQRLTLGGRVQFSSARSGSAWPPTSGDTFTWPSYQVYDLFGIYKVDDDATFNFSVENLTDQYYFGALTSIAVPSPGRTARISYTTTLNETTPLVRHLPQVRLGNASLGSPGSDWTGLYVGGHLGYGLGATKGITTAGDGTPGAIAATESADLNFRDLTRGFQGGFNYQFSNRMVIGVEGDFSWTKFGKTQNALATEDAKLRAGSFLQAKIDYQFDWTASLRGRIGYAFDRVLVYATGGLAFLSESEVRSQYQAVSGNVPSTQLNFREEASATRSGWTLGGGFEYALTNNWSLKGEYSYDHFGNKDFLFPNATAGVTLAYGVQTQICVLYYPPPRAGVCRVYRSQTVTIPGSSQTTNGRKAENDLDLHSIRIGLNYRF